jgi:hypothetical protein
MREGAARRGTLVGKKGGAKTMAQANLTINATQAATFAALCNNLPGDNVEITNTNQNLLIDVAVPYKAKLALGQMKVKGRINLLGSANTTNLVIAVTDNFMFVGLTMVIIPCAAMFVFFLLLGTMTVPVLLFTMLLTGGGLFYLASRVQKESEDAVLKILQTAAIKATSTR